MILQKLLFPKVGICSRNKMFFKEDTFTVLMGEECCLIPKGEALLTNTYFNSFSVGKWRKYTRINNLSLRLKLQGEFSVIVRHACKVKNNMHNNVVAEQYVCLENEGEAVIPIKLEETAGMYYFELKALSENARFLGGAYETEIDPAALQNVKLAIDICTFRREVYVAHNMQILRDEILENPESPLYGKLEIFISDNSKSLDPSLATDQIHIFPNKNLGGAGGFTRSLIEIKKVSAEKGITHILMMDDDIRLNPDSLLRTYAMLQLLKPEHKDAFIGGHMLRIDDAHIQSEAADHWDIVAHHPVKYNYNLERMEFIIKNEIEDSVNYLSWWYCCMPVNVVSDTNLPLPIFIKRDDIEYGLRNGKEFITLNGICVWHEPFEYKYSTYLEYYYFRNMCIMNSRHRLSFDAERLISELEKRVRNFLLTYRYKDAELSLLGIQDYLKGIDWLMRQDGEKLNGELMKLGYKKEPLENIDFVFIHGTFENNLKMELTLKQKIIRALTLNGWLLPANKNVVVPAYQPSPMLFYRANKVLNYEEVTNTGFITTRDRQNARYIMKLLRQTKKMIKRDFKRVTNEYRDRYDELINLKFWNKYLFEDGETPIFKSGLDAPRRPKNTKGQRKEIRYSRTLRFLQNLLFWLPVKRNRVMVYIHDRKGFTCNPKYIVKKLVELYGNKLEIIWVTMHPDTCGEIEKLGVKIMKSNTPEQLKAYLRTRFFITNDLFPSWALRRWNQKWMQTWHGAMNYKHIGYDYLAPMSPIAARIFKLQNRQPNFFLSGGEFFTQDTSKSFRLNPKIFLPTGLPRNDVFFADSSEIAAKVRKFYNIDPETKLAIFAPTFRRGMQSDTYGLDFEVLKKALSERFGGNWTILFRNHNFVKGKRKYGGSVDVSAYHDMQELMCAADVLISDYSSCLYDFCMSKKPAFVYATDLDNYRFNDRSFAYPFEKWPYPVATSNDQLVEVIKNFDQSAFEAKVAEHLRDAGAHDNGTASQQVAELIAKHCL